MILPQNQIQKGNEAEKHKIIKTKQTIRNTKTTDGTHRNKT